MLGSRDRPLHPSTILVLCFFAAGAIACDERGSTTSTGGEAVLVGSELPLGSEPVELDPADFTTEIDNSNPFA